MSHNENRQRTQQALDQLVHQGHLDRQPEDRYALTNAGRSFWSRMELLHHLHEAKDRQSSVSFGTLLAGIKTDPDMLIESISDLIAEEGVVMWSLEDQPHLYYFRLAECRTHSESFVTTAEQSNHNLYNAEIETLKALCEEKYAFTQTLFASGWKECASSAEARTFLLRKLGELRQSKTFEGEAFGRFLEIYSTSELNYFNQSRPRLALELKCPDLVEAILDSGLTILPNEYHLVNELLLIAATNNYSSLVRRLARLGANLDVQSDTGSTALIYAVVAQDYETVDLLLELGADQWIEDDDGRDAWDYAHMIGDKLSINKLINTSVPSCTFRGRRVPVSPTVDSDSLGLNTRNKCRGGNQTA